MKPANNKLPPNKSSRLNKFSEDWYFQNSNPRNTVALYSLRQAWTFKLTVHLEKSVPKVMDRKFITLNQPILNIDDIDAGKEEPYILKDITLRTSELKFIPLEYDGQRKIDMIVYLKNFRINLRNKNLPILINIIVQDLPGEKSMAANINLAQLAQMLE